MQRLNDLIVKNVPVLIVGLLAWCVFMGTVAMVMAVITSFAGEK